MRQKKKKHGNSQWAIMLLASLPALYYLYERLWGDADLYGEHAMDRMNDWMTRLETEMNEFNDANRKLIRAELLGDRAYENGDTTLSSSPQADVDALKDEVERRKRHILSEMASLDEALRRTNAHHLLHASKAGYLVLRMAMLQRDADIQLHALNILCEMAIVEPYARTICSSALLGPIFTTLTQSNNSIARQRSGDVLEYISRWESTHETLANWIEIYETIVRVNDPLDVEVTAVVLTRILSNRDIDRSKGRLLPVEVILRTIIDRNNRDSRARKVANIGLLYAQGKRDIADRHMTRRVRVDSVDDLLQQLKFLVGIPAASVLVLKLAGIATLPTMAISALMLAGTIGGNEMKILEREAHAVDMKGKTRKTGMFNNLAIASHLSSAVAIGALYHGSVPALAALATLYFLSLADPMLFRPSRASTVRLRSLIPQS